MTFPDGILAEDPAAPTGSIFFDRALSMWLRVGRSDVSPDGKRYAYSTLKGNAYQNSGSQVHVVDAATGADTVIYDGKDAFTIVDFAAEGIYVSGAVPEGARRGLWRLDLSDGIPRLISSTIIAPAIGNGIAWGIDFNPADPSPGPGGLEGPRNEVVRFDLQTGTATVWFYRPGASVYVAGSDHLNNVFVTASLAPGQSGAPDSELWRVTSATTATRLFTGTFPVFPWNVSAIDSHGAWLDAPYASAGPSMVWLYAGGTLNLVATFSQGDLVVAGGCIP